MAQAPVASSSETVPAIIERALSGAVLSAADGYALIRASGPQLTAVMRAAAEMSAAARPHRRVTYSRKVFLPLTNLCRDRCAYCTFVKGPKQRGARTMTPGEVVSVARRGAELGCKEALISLGDHPEWRHPEMSATLERLGYGSTPAYVAAISKLVFEETGLLPHTNCGVLDHDEMAAIAPWNASMGIMLESASLRLHERGGPHEGTSSKRPEQRIATLETAGELGVAMTSGILVGIGETPEERVDALLALRDVHDRHGNIQEIIVQNFRAKPTTRMHGAAEPTSADMLRTLSAARLLMGPAMNIQAPPNLAGDGFGSYLLTGMNDWGGVSPLTRDFINPEAAWPEAAHLRAVTADAGFELRERTALYPEYVTSGAWRTSAAVGARVTALTGADGYVRKELEQW